MRENIIIYIQDILDKQIHYNDGDGFEYWSDDHPNNPNYIGVEIDIEPFKFNTEK